MQRRTGIVWAEIGSVHGGQMGRSV
jgi:hypothetical protein